MSNSSRRSSRSGARRGGGRKSPRRSKRRTGHCHGATRWRHLRSAANRAARRGETIIIEGDVDNAGALLNELMRLHTASRFKRGGDVFSDPRVGEFQAAALPDLMKEGLGRLYALSIEA